jgi:hypothetical protein
VRSAYSAPAHLRTVGKGHLGDPHGRDLGDKPFDGDDRLAGRCLDGGFKMVEAAGFEAGHGILCNHPVLDLPSSHSQVEQRLLLKKCAS